MFWGDSKFPSNCKLLQLLLLFWVQSARTLQRSYLFSSQQHFFPCSLGAGVGGELMARVNFLLCAHVNEDEDKFDEHGTDGPLLLTLSSPFEQRPVTELGPREDDIFQVKDTEEIIAERSMRFYDPKMAGDIRERCVIVSVHKKLEERRNLWTSGVSFTPDESSHELCELCTTAGLAVVGSCFQRMYSTSRVTYIGPGKV